MKSKKIVLTICTQNRRTSLYQAIKHIHNQSILPDKIVVINSGNPLKLDQIPPFSHGRLIEQLVPPDTGLVEMRNTALMYAQKYDYYASIDDDIFLDKDWLKIGISCLQNNQTVDVVSGILYGNGNYWSNVAARHFFIDPLKDSDYCSKPHLIKTSFLPLPTWIIRSTTLNQSRIKFRELIDSRGSRIRITGEDIIFSTELHSLKYGLWIHTGMKAVHQFRTTCTAFCSRYYQYGCEAPPVESRPSTIDIIKRTLRMKPYYWFGIFLAEWCSSYGFLTYLLSTTVATHSISRHPLDKKLPFTLTMVICTVGKSPLLKQTVISILNQTVPPTKILIVNTGLNLDKNIRQLLHQAVIPHQVVTIKTGSIGKSKNLALTAVDTQYLAFIDDGITLNSNWIEQAITALSRHPKTKTLSGIIKGSDNYWSRCSARQSFSYLWESEYLSRNQYFQTFFVPDYATIFDVETLRAHPELKYLESITAGEDVGFTTNVLRVTDAPALIYTAMQSIHAFNSSKSKFKAHYYQHGCNTPPIRHDYDGHDPEMLVFRSSPTIMWFRLAKKVITTCYKVHPYYWLGIAIATASHYQGMKDFYDNQHRSALENNVVFLIEQVNSGGLSRCNINMAKALAATHHITAVIGVNQNQLGSDRDMLHEWRQITTDVISIPTKPARSTILSNVRQMKDFFIAIYQIKWSNHTVFITNLPASMIATRLACSIKHHQYQILHLFHGLLKQEKLSALSLQQMSAWSRLKCKLSAEWLEKTQLVAAKSASYTLTCSKYAHDEIKTNLGIDSLHFNPPVYIPNNNLRSKSVSDAFKIIVPNRIEPRKGTHIVLEAARQLHHQKRHYQFSFVGGTWHDQYWLDLFEKYSSYRLFDTVTWIGQQSFEITHQMVVQSDIMIMSSTTGETLGFSTLEALLSGVVVIGSASGATPEILSQISPQLVFKNDNVEDLIKHIHWVSHLTSTKKQELIQKGRRLVRTQFSSNQFTTFFDSMNFLSNTSQTGRLPPNVKRR